MAGTATLQIAAELEPNYLGQGEEYAHSASTLRRWGEFIIDRANSGENTISSYEELGYDDFFTAVAEMLKTDEEHRKKLEVNRQHSHNIIDNKVCATDGTPMVDLIRTGHESSRQAALINPELEGQVERDGLDVDNAERVDELQPGMTRLVLSMPPKQLLKKYPKTYEELGYEGDLAYIQTYSKVDEKNLVTGSYSIDVSDESTWRPLLKELGFEIPDDESPDTWIKHGLETQMSPEDAKQFALSLRQEYYERRGSSGERFSANEYCERNESIIKDYFNAYYPAMAEAIATGHNNDVMRGLALAVLQAKTDKLKTEIKTQLMRIGNSNKFDTEAAKVMDSVIRYAAVEELRVGLNRFTNKQLAKQQEQLEQFSTPKQIVQSERHLSPELADAAMHARLANNVSCGIEAGRSYGGCPGKMQLSGDKEVSLGLSIDSVLPNPQQAYGGEDCIEIKDGQRVKCPGCKRHVKAIVPNRESIYCSNGDCALAEPSLKRNKSVTKNAARTGRLSLVSQSKKTS